MKVFTLVICALAACIAGPLDDAKFKQILGKCVSDVHATPDDVKNMMEPNIKVPVTHEGKCLLACFYKSMGMMTADGRANNTAVIEATMKAKTEMGEEMYKKVMEIINKCDSEVELVDDACENAAAYMECGNKYKEKMGIPDI